MKVTRRFGYLHGINPLTGKTYEDFQYLSEYGSSPEDILAYCKTQEPTHDPFRDNVLDLRPQANMGSCVGHGLSHGVMSLIEKITGVKCEVSRMCGYIRSQQATGIRGDNGALISGAQKAAEQGLCLEKEWTYPSRYTDQVPSSAQGNENIRVTGSQNIKDVDLMWELLEQGQSILIGVAWTGAFEAKYCDRYSSAGTVGGHCTLIDGLHEANGQVWAVNKNSWRGWQGDMTHHLSKNFINGILRQDKWSVFVTMDPRKLILPDNFRERVTSA